MNPFTRFTLLLLLLLLAACGGADPAPTAVPPTAAADPEPTDTAVADAPTAETDAEDEAAADGGDPTTLMDDLSSDSPVVAQDALDQVLESGDQRYIPVLIELFRAAQIGVVRSFTPERYAAALEELSGQDFGGDWFAWIEWYGQTDLQPPPGFTGWKGELMGRIDPALGEFLQDEFPSDIRVEEIQWGGVVVDGIPALDNPAMIPADEERYLELYDPVFGVALNGDARAYPLLILDWHEMANDVIGGVPVSIAYCTLCGAAIAYDGRASDGETYTFGSSGYLFRSNKLMYDRQTRTLWNQLTGEPVLGELVGSGVTLDLLPIVLTTWGDWQKQYPETLILAPDTGYNRVYEPGAAYGDYFQSPQTMFPVWQRGDALEDKAQVYALNINGNPKAYPLEALTAETVVNDTVGDTAVVLIAPEEIVEVQGDSMRTGPVRYNAGAEVRAYERGDHTFTPGPDRDTLLDETGAAWQITEIALLGPDGAELPRQNGHLAYWFGWYAFYPETAVYGE